VVHGSNVVRSLVTTHTIRFASFVSCVTVSFATCYKELANNWEAVRRRGWNTPKINRVSYTKATHTGTPWALQDAPVAYRGHASTPSPPLARHGRDPAALPRPASLASSLQSSSPPIPLLGIPSN